MIPDSDSMIRQRHPREEHPAYLAWIRTQPCLVCRKPGPSDPAHLRSAALRYGKPHTGLGEKPDDRWAVPLCRKHHEEQHAFGSELAWWAAQGIEPFAVAVRLYENRPAMPPPRVPKPSRKTPPRKPKAERRAIPGRKLQSRNTLRKATR